MNRKWILAGALSLGLTVVAPASFAKDRDKDKDDKKVAVKHNRKDVDEQVRYRDLPKAVQDAVQEKRGKHEVKSYWHVVRDGDEFYRAVLDTKGDDTILRFSEAGKLLGKQEVKDTSDKEIVTKSGTVKRAVRLHTGESDGEEVEFERLPGAVKSKIASLAKSDKVDEVIRYRRGGATMYRAEVGEGKYTRYIRVTEGGDVDRVSGDIDPGEKVPFDRLPGAPKSKIGALAKSGKVDEVIEYKRGRKTYYQAEVDEKGGNRTFFYTVDAEGNEVQGLPRVED
jgi:hypothetical protein